MANNQEGANVSDMISEIEQQIQQYHALNNNNADKEMQYRSLRNYIDLIADKINNIEESERIVHDLLEQLGANPTIRGGRKHKTRKTRNGKKRSMRKSHYKRHTKRNTKRNTKRSNKSRKH